jgi:hypothetical protein
MQPLVILMLGLQVAVALTAAASIVVRRPTPERPKPVWSSLAFSLTVVAGVSLKIADKRDGGAGVEVLHFGAAVLVGMAISLVLIALRERRGLDQL